MLFVVSFRAKSKERPWEDDKGKETEIEMRMWAWHTDLSS